MQLYALDENNLISSIKAAKQCNYACLECGGIVRLRGGPQRHPHFYHVATTQKCRLNGKTLMHLHVQTYIQKLLPHKDCALEYRFPAINRIADVVWLSEKIIFEIQCSAISAEELQSRQEDYASQGFQVIWIFHDKRYNKEKLTAAEISIKNHPHYFTDMDENGKGVIYDQLAYLVNDVNHIIVTKCPIKVASIRKINAPLTSDRNNCIPQALISRGKQWTVSFAGDLIDLCFFANPTIEVLLQLECSCEAERAWETMKKRSAKDYVYSLWRRFVVKPYHLVFRVLLESACK